MSFLLNQREVELTSRELLRLDATDGGALEKAGRPTHAFASVNSVLPGFKARRRGLNTSGRSSIVLTSEDQDRV